MSAPEQVTHDADCWRVHDDCALSRAEAYLTDKLRYVRDVITDHLMEPCSNPGNCHAARIARQMLAPRGWASGATEYATGSDDRGLPS